MKNLIKQLCPQREAIHRTRILAGIDFSDLMKIQEGILEAIKSNVPDPAVRARIAADLGKCSLLIHGSTRKTPSD